jgi:hypothetical protein
MRSIICTVMILLLTACSPPGSKLVGKWSVESDSAKFWGTTKNTTKPIVEFTTAEIIRDGFHDPVELADQGNDVVVCRTMFGIKFGTTYKFINNDTAEVAMLGDKQTLHRVH